MMGMSAVGVFFGWSASMAVDVGGDVAGWELSAVAVGGEAVGGVDVGVNVGVKLSSCA